MWVPDAAHEALRDLVRAREAAKTGPTARAPSAAEFLLRHGRRAPAGMQGVDAAHFAVGPTGCSFEHAAQEATLLDYVHEVDHAAERIDAARAGDRRGRGDGARRRMRAVIDALQALRGIARVSAVTIVAEVGGSPLRTSRAQLMGYSGVVAARTLQRRPDPAGRHHQDRQRPPAPHRHRSRVGLSPSAGRRRTLRDASGSSTRTSRRSPGRRSIGCTRATARSSAAANARPQVVTAIGRELLGFIWAIGVRSSATRRRRRHALAA